VFSSFYCPGSLYVPPTDPRPVLLSQRPPPFFLCGLSSQPKSLDPSRFRFPPRFTFLCANFPPPPPVISPEPSCGTSISFFFFFVFFFLEMQFFFRFFFRVRVPGDGVYKRAGTPGAFFFRIPFSRTPFPYRLPIALGCSVWT